MISTPFFGRLCRIWTKSCVVANSLHSHTFLFFRGRNITSRLITFLLYFLHVARRPYITLDISRFCLGIQTDTCVWNDKSNEVYKIVDSVNWSEKVQKLAHSQTTQGLPDCEWTGIALK